MLGLLAALGLVLLNGFFVAAEFSMVRVRPQRLEQLAKRRVPGAARAARIARQVDRYLSASQIGITVASLALGWIGEPAAEQLIDALVRMVTGHALGAAMHPIGAAFAFLVITYLHVLLGEQVPKMIALYRAEQVAVVVAAPFHLLYLLLTPVRVVLEVMTATLLSAGGLRGSVHSEGALSVEELTSVIAATLVRGPNAEEKRALLDRVVRFASRQARHAMVPRVDVAYLPVETSGADAILFLRIQEFSRIVLTERDELDKSCGYLFAKDLLLNPKAASLPDLRTVRRDLLIVPESQSLIEVLRAMQQAHTLFALVVDEYGGTSGILTMEDLLEEIVGEIRDEADEEPPSIVAVAEAPGAFDVEPAVLLDELRALGFEVADADTHESLGAVVLRQLGRLPRIGDHVIIGSIFAEVRALRRRRLTKVRVRPRRASLEPAEPH